MFNKDRCRGVCLKRTSAGGRPRLQLLRDLLEDVGLDDVADLVFVEVAELDTALEAHTDFLHVVLAAPQRATLETLLEAAHGKKNLCILL